jgi:hypothetical protein
MFISSPLFKEGESFVFIVTGWIPKALILRFAAQLILSGCFHEEARTRAFGAD